MVVTATPTPTPNPVGTGTPTPAPTPTPTPAGLAGKISWSCNHICLFDLATSTNTDTGVSGVNSKFSRDGTKIAFTERGGIYVMNADGTNPKNVSSFGALPAWSPDGNKIAFNSNGIWVMNADGSGLQQLTNQGAWPAWSPDGSEIAFSLGGLDLWIMNWDGTNAHQVLSSLAGVIDVVWSPSSRILFGGFVNKQAGYEIFAFDPAGTGTLYPLMATGFEPAASPDGTKIAFAFTGKPAGIYIMNSDGSSLQLIIPGGRQPSWGP